MSSERSAMVNYLQGGAELGQAPLQMGVDGGRGQTRQVGDLAGGPLETVNENDSHPLRFGQVGQEPHKGGFVGSLAVVGALEEEGNLAATDAALADPVEIAGWIAQGPYLRPVLPGIGQCL